MPAARDLWFGGRFVRPELAPQTTIDQQPRTIFMCGITGVLYADLHRTPDKAVLKAMGDAIAHRGPDGEGFFKANNVGLVHRRLAIIDLAGGNQPIANEDESVQVVFNGEIYNYPELKQQLESRGHVFRTNSDTEVLVHLYEEHGRGLVKHLRGMFAFALWDARPAVDAGSTRDRRVPLRLARDFHRRLWQLGTRSTSGLVAL